MDKRLLIGLGIIGGALGVVAYKKREELAVFGKKMLKAYMIGARQHEEYMYGDPDAAVGDMLDGVGELARADDKYISHFFSFHATGVTFKDRQDLIRYTNKDTGLHFKKNPVEEDKNAVAIVDDHSRILGWVPRTIAPHIGGKMDKELINIVSWRKVGGENDYKYGLVITVDDKTIEYA